MLSGSLRQCYLPCTILVVHAGAGYRQPAEQGTECIFRHTLYENQQCFILKVKMSKIDNTNTMSIQWESQECSSDAISGRRKPCCYSRAWLQGALLAVNGSRVEATSQEWPSAVDQ